MTKITFNNGNTILYSDSVDNPYRGANYDSLIDAPTNYSDAALSRNDSCYNLHMCSKMTKTKDVPVFDFTAAKNMTELSLMAKQSLNKPVAVVLISDFVHDDMKRLIGKTKILDYQFMTMHQYNTWLGGACEDSSCSDCTDCTCNTVDREKYPHDCICGHPCYISVTPMYSECSNCDDPKEKK